MEALYQFYLPLALYACPLKPNHSSIRSHFSGPTSRPRASPFRNILLLRKARHTVAFVGNPNKGGGSSQFLDENGVVDDMDGYLNHLSLEYDSVWDTKPSWCQPWTITLTGVLSIAFSWLILQSVVVTSIVSLLIVTWWYIFLYSYPKAYAEMIAERRRRVTSGIEDTFGVTKSE